MTLYSLAFHRPFFSALRALHGLEKRSPHHPTIQPPKRRRSDCIYTSYCRHKNSKQSNQKQHRCQTYIPPQSYLFIMDQIQSRPSFDRAMETTPSDAMMKRTARMSDVRTMADTSIEHDSFLFNDEIASTYFDLRRPARSTQIPEFIVTRRSPGSTKANSQDGSVYNGIRNEQWDILTSISTKTENQLFQAFIRV